MKDKKVLIVVFILVLGIVLFFCNSNNKKTLYNIDRVYSSSYNMVNNGEKKDIDINSKSEIAIYEYFKEAYNKKVETTSNSYVNYEKNNLNSKLYENISEFIYETKNYSENEYNLYNDLKNYSKKENFIKYLKDKKIYRVFIKYLDEKIATDEIIDYKSITNNVIFDKEKFDSLIEYTNYLDNNKDKWYYVNKIIVCKDGTVLKTIENKNKELGINIKAMMEKYENPSDHSKKIPVLMYHGVSDVTWGISNLFVKVDDFDRQMKYISENYKTIFIEDIENYGREKMVALTFDDGYVDFYTNAFPILKKYNLKANLYIIADADGGVYLSDDQIKELADSNLVSIGSHTVSHAALAKLNPEKLDYELRESKSIIENITKKEVKTICYPYGSYNDDVLKTASKYYKYGLVIEDKTQKLIDGFNKYKITRLSVYRNTSFSKFKNMVDEAN